jgi:hypothetical protein
MSWYDTEYLADSRDRTLTEITPEMKAEIRRIQSSTRRVVKAVSGEFERLVRDGYRIIQSAGSGSYLRRNPRRKARQFDLPPGTKVLIHDSLSYNIPGTVVRYIPNDPRGTHWNRPGLTEIERITPWGLRTGTYEIYEFSVVEPGSREEKIWEENAARFRKKMEGSSGLANPSSEYLQEVDQLGEWLWARGKKYHLAEYTDSKLPTRVVKVTPKLEEAVFYHENQRLGDTFRMLKAGRNDYLSGYRYLIMWNPMNRGGSLLVVDHGGTVQSPNPTYNTLSKDQFNRLKKMSDSYSGGDLYLGEIRLGKGETFGDALVAAKKLSESTGVEHDVVQHQGRLYSAPEQWVSKILVDDRMKLRSQREAGQLAAKQSKGLIPAVKAAWRELVGNPDAAEEQDKVPGYWIVRPGPAAGGLYMMHGNVYYSTMEDLDQAEDITRPGYQAGYWFSGKTMDDVKKRIDSYIADYGERESNPETRSNPGNDITIGHYLINKRKAVFHGAPDNLTSFYKLPDGRVVVSSWDGWEVRRGEEVVGVGVGLRELHDYLSNEPARVAARSYAERMEEERAKEQVAMERKRRSVRDFIEKIRAGMEKATGVGEVEYTGPGRIVPEAIITGNGVKVTVRLDNGDYFTSGLGHGRQPAKLFKYLAKYGQWEA